MKNYPEWLKAGTRRFKADILAFGPHPDDVELNIGGILALHAQQNKVVVIDLTEGEMASNGTLEERRSEYKRSGELLKLAERRNLYLPDGAISPTDLEQQNLVVSAIRYYQPEIILLPYWEDRHPDHVAAGKLIDICLFKAGLKKFHGVGQLLPYKPSRWYYYFQHHDGIPDLVVDITQVYQQKLNAISAYQSQFFSADCFQTFINSPTFLQKIMARDQYFGGMIGVKYGEGLISKSPISVSSLLK